MTASNMQGDREKCLEAGMDGYLSIPPHKSKMVDILVNWLEESSLPQE
jgi:two-component system, sensor histidine kinase and response regulator